MQQHPARQGLTRQQFLRGGGLVALSLMGSRYVLVDPAAQAETPAFVPGGPGPSHVVTVHRREDLLDLRFECWNLVVSDQGGHKRLVRMQKNQPAYLVIVFPPQATAEQVLDERHTPLPFDPCPADESQLAFQLPTTVEHLDYTFE